MASRRQLSPEKRLTELISAEEAAFLWVIFVHDFEKHINRMFFYA